MRSYFSSTDEFVDMDEAAYQLLENVPLNDLFSNNLGILFCDSQIEDYQELLDALHEKITFPIVGCTTSSTLDKFQGLSETSTVFMVLTSQDCRFHTNISAPLTTVNAEDEIEKTYLQANSLFDGNPAMIFTFAPHGANIMMDTYSQVLSRVSGDVPVFGGLSGYNKPYGRNAVIFNNAYHSDRLVLVLMEGNIKPVFSVGIQLSHVADSGTVTKADKNELFTIDELSIPQYFSKIGFDASRLLVDKTGVTYASNPFILTEKGKTKDEYSLVRTLYHLNEDAKSAKAIGLIPEGHTISIGLLTKKDIREAAEIGLKKLLAQIDAIEASSDYRFCAVIATSCVGRYMVMLPNVQIEGDVFKELIPERLNFIGYYGYGELGPTSVNEQGIAINTAQNASLTLCAF